MSKPGKRPSRPAWSLRQQRVS